MKKPTNIYEILQPMYIISKILGLAPFNLKNHQLIPQYGPIIPLKMLIIVGGMCYIAVSVEGSKDITGIAAFALKCELYLGMKNSKTNWRFKISNFIFSRHIYDICSIDAICV